MRKKFRKSVSIRQKLQTFLTSTFTVRDENVDSMNRIKRLSLRKNRVIVLIFSIGVLIYGVGLALYLLHPMLHFFNTGSKKQIIVPLSQEGSIESFKKELIQSQIYLTQLSVATDDATLIGTLDTTTIYFDRYKDVSSQVSTLQKILARLTIDGSTVLFGGKRTTIIDLRYDKPIVKY